MKINETVRYHCDLSEIGIGDVFEYNGCLYMRINTYSSWLPNTGILNPPNCLNLHLGVITRIELNEEVIPVEVELNILKRGL